MRSTKIQVVSVNSNKFTGTIRKCTSKYHVGERMMPIENFSPRPKTESDGYDSSCKECRREATRQHRAKKTNIFDII